MTDVYLTFFLFFIIGVSLGMSVTNFYWFRKESK